MYFAYLHSMENNTKAIQVVLLGNNIYLPLQPIQCDTKRYPWIKKKENKIAKDVKKILENILSAMEDIIKTLHPFPPLTHRRRAVPYFMTTYAKGERVFHCSFENVCVINCRVSNQKLWYFCIALQCRWLFANILLMFFICPVTVVICISYLKDFIGMAFRKRFSLWFFLWFLYGTNSFDIDIFFFKLKNKHVELCGERNMFAEETYIFLRICTLFLKSLCISIICHNLLFKMISAIHFLAFLFFGISPVDRFT